MNYIMTLEKMKEVFINLGFESVTINDSEYLRYKNCYCKVVFLRDWSAFVIESADNLQDAEIGVLEDGDLYYTDVSESELLSQLREDLIRYYFSD